MDIEGNSLLGGSPEPVAPSQQGPEITDEATKSTIGVSDIFGDDFKFKEGWKEGLSKLFGDTEMAREIKDSPTLDRYKDFPSAIKSLLDTKKMVGANKIAIPGANASPEQIAEYFRAVGAPESAEGYQFNIPDEVKDNISEELLGSAKKVFASEHLTPKQAQGVMDFYLDLESQKASDFASSIQAEKTEAFNELNKEWGAAYQQKLTKVSNFFRNLGLSEVIAETGLGRNAAFIKAFESKVVDKLSESNTLLGAEENLTPGSIDDQIKDALHNPQSPYNRKVPGAQEALNNLYKAKAQLMKS